jgi:hypothetical protein
MELTTCRTWLFRAEESPLDFMTGRGQDDTTSSPSLTAPYL